jgi:hypothetical protein
MRKPPRLVQLYKLLEMVDSAMLGNDWQSKQELRKVRKATIAEIKDIEQKLHEMNMVQ